MRHHSAVKKFGRKRKGRVALLRTLAHSLFREGTIMTTEAKAKALRPYAEKLITHARVNTPASRRLVLSRMGSAASLKTLFGTVAPQFLERKGGYTRVVKAGFRKSDGAKMAVIELV